MAETKTTKTELKQRELLAELHRRAGAAEKIELAIENGSKELSRSTKWSYGNVAGEVSRKILEEVHSISDTHAELEGALLYFCLDKKLFPKIHGYFPREMERSINFTEAVPGSNYYENNFNGRHYMTVYKHESGIVIDFLEENISLLPKSAMNYARKKQKERERRLSLEDISDGFKGKIFERNIEGSFSYSDMVLELKKFRNLEDGKDKAGTLINFHSILGRKYPEEDNNPKLKDLKESTMNAVFALLSSVLTNTCHLDWCQDTLKTFRRIALLGENSKTLEAMFERIGSKGAKIETVAFMESIAQTAEYKEIVERLWEAKVEEGTRFSVLKYKDAPKEYQQSMIREAKRQFFEKNPYWKMV